MSKPRIIIVQESQPKKRSNWAAFKLYIRDADKKKLVHVARTAMAVLAGYAPFAALNDVLLVTVVDDVEIPFGIAAAITIWRGIQRYR